MSDAVVGKALGPRSPSEEIVYACERFRIDVQVMILAAMKSKEVDRDELAKRLGASRKYVDDLFDEGTYLNVRTIARIAHVIGLSPSVFFEQKTTP